MILIVDPDLATSRQFQLALGVYGGTVNVTVDWGDGTSNSYTTSGIKSHTYAAEVTGLQTVTVSGTLNQWGGNANISGLVRVDNIGYQLGLTSLREAFRNVTTNTTFVNPDLPPQITSLRGAFYSGNPGFDLGALDTSNITDMSEMFAFSTFNGDISGLDTSNVTTMERMFYSNLTFNQPIGSWDVSKVTNFERMFFAQAEGNFNSFNQDIGAWDVSSATTMHAMFGIGDTGSGNDGRNVFNNGGSPSIANWDVSNVLDFSNMFGPTNYFNVGSSAFNQPIGSWDVSSAQDMAYMFYATDFNQDLSGWALKVGNCLDFTKMFNDSAMNSPLTGWQFNINATVAYMFPRDFQSDVSNMVLPANCSNMCANGFDGFNPVGIGTWDTSNATNMNGMFFRCYNFNQDISGWDTSNVTNMAGMFQGANKFNQPIASWDVSNVTSMNRMFNMWIDDNAFNQPLDGWDTSNVADFTNMFFSQNDNYSRFWAQDIAALPLRKAGVNMTNLFYSRGGNYYGQPYSETLIGFANTVYDQNGPFTVQLTSSLYPPKYDNVVYDAGGRYPSAIEARAFLTNPDQMTVASAGNALADGDYIYSALVQLYVNANDWYFVQEGGVWYLKDNTDTVQATQQDVDTIESPYQVTTWDGTLSAATVDRTGAGWTIVDGGLI